MARISIWQRRAISRTAKRDANGAYGRTLKKLPEGSGDYSLSAYMEQLADEYERSCKNVIDKKKSISKLYSKIIEEYELLNDIISIKDGQRERMQGRLGELDEKLKSLQQLQEELNRKWISTQQNGEVDLQTGAMTFSMLKKKIDTLEVQRGSLESEITQIKSSINKMDGERKEEIGEANQKLYKYLKLYRNKLDALYRRIASITNRYEQRLHYYWRVLIRSLGGIPLKSKSFSEVCQLRSVQVFTKENILQDEREIINSEIKGLIGFEIDI